MDISVLILFFNRPDTLKQVFEAVREARPARLFLYQDGPRGERDVPLIEACRKVVENVDWPCEVHRNYQEVNAGCDPSGFNAHRWAFSLTDRCIVLEDDVVPTQSYFRFCEEMLERYKDDERVGMITGFNLEEETPDVGDADYFFSSAFTSMGWASWARVVNGWDGDYAFWHDEATRNQLLALIKARGLKNEYPRIFSDHASSGKEYFETIFQTYMLLHSQLSIVTRVNMMRNVGLGDDSTHTTSAVDTLPRAYRRIFTMKSHELQFPLRHPRYMVDHVAYKERLYLIQAWNNPLQKVKYSIEELWLNLRKGNFTIITKAIGNRINKLLGRKRYA